MNNQENKIKELTEACNILGLDASEFVEIPEINKSVEQIDYKTLYETQKALNIKIIETISKIPNIITDKIDVKVTEFQKSVDGINEKIAIFESSPLHKRKSISNVDVIEKGITKNNENNTSQFSLANPFEIKKLKNFLGNKTIEALEKGVNNSIYEKAALQLDANKTLSDDIINRLFQTCKIQVIR